MSVGAWPRGEIDGCLAQWAIRRWRALRGGGLEGGSDVKGAWPRGEIDGFKAQWAIRRWRALRGGALREEVRSWGRGHIYIIYCCGPFLTLSPWSP
jgi:hypothetical protein